MLLCIVNFLAVARHYSLLYDMSRFSCTGLTTKPRRRITLSFFFIIVGRLWTCVPCSLLLYEASKVFHSNASDTCTRLDKYSLGDTEFILFYSSRLVAVVRWPIEYAVVASRTLLTSNLAVSFTRVHFKSVCEDSNRSAYDWERRWIRRYSLNVYTVRG